MTFREIINVCQNRTKHKKYTVLGKVETLSVTACGAKYRIIIALSNVTADDTVCSECLKSLALTRGLLCKHLQTLQLREQCFVEPA